MGHTVSVQIQTKMLSKFLALTLAGYAVADPISRLEVSGVSDTGFTVDIVLNKLEEGVGHKVEAFKDTDYSVAAESTGTLDFNVTSHSFSDLTASSLYGIRVTPYNLTDDSVFTDESFKSAGRTDGALAAIKTVTWDGGFNGYVVFPLSGIDCAYVFTINYGVAVTSVWFGASAAEKAKDADLSDFSEQLIYILSDDKTSATVILSGRALDSFDFLAFGGTGDDTFAGAITVTEEALSDEVTALSIDDTASWTTAASGVVSQVTVLVPESVRRFCLDSITFELACTGVKLAGKWSIGDVTIVETDDPTTSTFALTDVWQSSFGLAFSHAEACVATPTFSAISKIWTPGA